MSRPVSCALVGVVLALGLAGCTPVPGPSSTSSSRSTPSAVPPSPNASAPTPVESPTPARTLLPGEPCDPADGSPDCTDATGAADGQYRYIEGYADCVANLPGEEYGLCTDLDDDGHAGYPDSH